MKLHHVFLLGFSMLMAVGCTSFMPGPNPPAIGQTEQVWSRFLVKDIRYLFYLPEDYYESAGHQWPVILFLHGAGERGSDLNLVTKHGPPKLTAADG